MDAGFEQRPGVAEIVVNEEEPRAGRVEPPQTNVAREGIGLVAVLQQRLQVDAGREGACRLEAEQ